MNSVEETRHLQQKGHCESAGPRNMKTIDVEQLGCEVSKLIKQESDLTILIDHASHFLAEFAADTRWFYRVVREKLFQDGSIFNINSIWSNEITLLRSPGKELSIFAYIWEPRRAFPIHDHGAWGVVAASIQPFVERKFQRLDNGSQAGFAVLKETLCKMVTPGDTSPVLPLDRGIHQLENTSDKYMVSLSMFAQPVRSGYLQFYYPEKQKVERVYPPKTHRQVLSIRTLETIDEPWADELLADMLNRDLPSFIKDECRLSIKKRK